MDIVIDARFYGLENTGLGRYTTNVMRYLPATLKKHHLYVLLRKKYFHKLRFPKNVTKVLCDIPHYSLREQIYLSRYLSSLAHQLFFSFHFNVPIFSRVPTVVTIHDLIKTYSEGKDTTTHGQWLYRLKRFGYSTVMDHAVHSLGVIVPTNTVKNMVLSRYPDLSPERIYAIPEAPDPLFTKNQKHKVQSFKLDLPKNFLLFVGNAYPHKNLSLLLRAMVSLPEYDLALVAKPTPYLDKCLSATPANVSSRLHLMSSLSDTELLELYCRAQALVTPSLMEGYGLPGLEALIVGTPVVASDIPSFREVYGDKVTYFSPHSAPELVRAVRLATSLSHSPLQFARTWKNVACDIGEVIDESCARL